jgi:ankyrin repeat protein
MNKCPSLDLNRITREGQTLLHVAIESLNLNMVKFLIYNKASLHVKDNKGKTPYELLVERKLSYLIKAKETETSSEGHSKRTKVVNINIHQVKEENIEGMFKGIRKYFDKKLLPKMDSNKSLLEPPSSVASSSFDDSDGFEEQKSEYAEYRPKAINELNKKDIIS